ncbi:MAG: hypothetical protein JWP78_365 [Mucilaginibacter sp.]|nr:hypothetical protein [Mucilaginibacter sp.]
MGLDVNGGAVNGGMNAGKHLLTGRFHTSFKYN